MIKGCQRKMIVIKETGSPYFDAAYFVLRCDLPKSAKDSDMMTEAHRMIENCSPKSAVQSTPQKKAITKSEVLIIALLCAIVPTMAAVGIMCLFL